MSISPNEVIQHLQKTKEIIKTAQDGIIGNPEPDWKARYLEILSSMTESTVVISRLIDKVMGLIKECNAAYDQVRALENDKAFAHQALEAVRSEYILTGAVAELVDAALYEEKPNDGPAAR